MRKGRQRQPLWVAAARTCAHFVFHSTPPPPSTPAASVTHRRCRRLSTNRARVPAGSGSSAAGEEAVRAPWREGEEGRVQGEARSGRRVRRTGPRLRQAPAAPLTGVLRHHLHFVRQAALAPRQPLPHALHGREGGHGGRPGRDAVGPNRVELSGAAVPLEEWERPEIKSGWRRAVPAALRGAHQTKMRATWPEPHKKSLPNRTPAPDQAQM